MAAGGVHNPRRLAGDRRLEVDEGKRRCLDELRFADRRRHSQQRLIGKDGSALGNAPDIARESQATQVFEEPRRHAAQSGLVAEALHFLVVELESFEEFDRRFEAGGNQERAPRGKTPDEQLEGRRGGFVTTGHEIAGHHRQLIQVGGKRRGGHAAMVDGMQEPRATLARRR